MPKILINFIVLVEIHFMSIMLVNTETDYSILCYFYYDCFILQTIPFSILGLRQRLKLRMVQQVC